MAYAAAKSGLLGLMRTLAVEWAPHRIRSNAILVGFVETEMTQDVDRVPARAALVARVPLGSTGSPTDIGQAAAFLASAGGRLRDRVVPHRGRRLEYRVALRRESVSP